ncbi:hypothetical protein GYB59_01335 [bacterium]|nr:hypothetical protein [bacterium]
MGAETNFKRVTAPGLPAWPRLYLDAGQGRAVVPLRLTTWRSWERAYLTTQGMAVLLNLLAAAYAWHWLAFLPNVIVRGVITFVAYGVAATITKPLVPAAFAGFLARQLFSFRSTAWFTPHVVAFRSPLYENGVQLTRTWQGQPVQVRFDMGPDREAQTRLANQQSHAQQRRQHYQSAQLLRLVIATADPYRTPHAVNQMPTMRSLPLAEIDAEDVAAVVSVLTAASMLTGGRGETAKTHSAGHDIDTSPV